VANGPIRAVDLFAGPGGWDTGIEPLGIFPIGIEYDDAACATRLARGHKTVQADVAALDPLDFAPCDLLIASPPCQAFSTAGKGDGHKDVELIMACARAFGRGEDIRAEVRGKLADERSILVVEPLRWAFALRPAHIALEQVPPVLPLWEAFADILRGIGYGVWAGVLNAADYGVPQTRRRAILMASLGSGVHPPNPTHTNGGAHTLEGELLPWVSMAQALGWGMTERPGLTFCGSNQGGPDLAGGSGARSTLERERERGVAVVTTRGDRKTPGGNQFDASNPSWTVTEKARSWTRSEIVLRSGNQKNAFERSLDEPAPTIAFGHNSSGVRFYDRRQNQGPAGEREPVRMIPDTEPAPTIGAAGLSTGRDRWLVDPAPTITTTRRSSEGILVGRQLPPGEGRNIGGRNWTATDPATTITADQRISARCHHDDGSQSGNATPSTDVAKGDYDGRTAIRIQLHEASVLQGFPPDYPWQGSRTKQFEQVGNAVPPPLAFHIICALIGAQELKEAA
jgi:DNA (cytosine-5)-methyltransferase 1